MRTAKMKDPIATARINQNMSPAPYALIIEMMEMIIAITDKISAIVRIIFILFIKIFLLSLKGLSQHKPHKADYTECNCAPNQQQLANLKCEP